MSQPQRMPAVAVWRDHWLPASETFVRDHVESLRSWAPVPIGLTSDRNGLDVQPTIAPFRRGLPLRLRLRTVGLLGSYRKYQEVLHRHDVRLVHAHFLSGGLHALPLCRKANLPLVVTAHGVDVTALPRGFRGRLHRRRLRRLFRQSSHVIAVSDFIRERLLLLGAPAEKVSVGYLGIPLRATPRMQEREGIAFLGRFVHKKGAADLLRAVDALPGALRQTPVRLIGYGPLEPELRRLADQLGVRATFLGQRDSEGIVELLAGCAVFCAPSRTGADGDSEGFGLVFLEAAAAGLPVIAYRHGGVPEAVVDGETGLLATEGDIEDLRNQLARVLDNPPLGDHLGAQGRIRARTIFDIDSCTERLESRYYEVAGIGAERKAAL